MKKAIPYFLIILVSIFLSGCGSEPVNPSDIECNEDLSPVMGCEILPEGKLKCTNPPEIVQRVLPSIQIVIIEGAEKIYKSINTPAFQRIVSAVLILYLVMYGFYVAAGLTDLELGDVIQRLVRISIIGFLLSEAGTTFYFGIMEKIWITAPDEIMNILIAPIIETKDFIMDKNITSHQNILEEIFKILQNASDTNMDSTGSSGIVGLPFMMLDLVFATVFSPRSVAFYIALWTYGGAGKILFVVVLITLFLFTLTICKAIFDYVVSLLFRTVLIGIGFVFILLSLFSKTREKFFGSWILRLLTYTFQPIFLFTFLGVIAVLVNVVFLDLTEGQFTAGQTREVSDKNMQMTKNRVCYHENKGVIYDDWAWQFSRHDKARSVMRANFDFNENWGEAVFMIFLFASIVWMSYKGADAAKMVPELMFAFAPISVSSGVGRTDLPGMVGQAGISVLETGGSALREMNPLERQGLYDAYYRGKNAGEEGAGLWGKTRATLGNFYGKARIARARDAAKTRWSGGWRDYHNK